MQITETYSNGTLPISQGGGVPARIFADELRKQCRYHCLIQVKRPVGFWWCRLLLIAISGLNSSYLAPFFQSNPKIILGSLGAIVLLFFIVKYADWGLHQIAIFATAFFPVVLVNLVMAWNVSNGHPGLDLLFGYW